MCAMLSQVAAPVLLQCGTSSVQRILAQRVAWMCRQLGCRMQVKLSLQLTDSDSGHLPWGDSCVVHACMLPACTRLHHPHQQLLLE